MRYIHCPFLDLLGHELIEAYRQNESLKGGGSLEMSSEVREIHKRMSKHRESCEICRRNSLVAPIFGAAQNAPPGFSQQEQ